MGEQLERVIGIGLTITSLLLLMAGMTLSTLPSATSAVERIVVVSFAVVFVLFALIVYVWRCN